MNIICYLFIFLFEHFISYIYFNNKFEKKRKATFLLMVYALSFSIQYAISFISIPELNLISFLLCNIAVAILCYHISIKQTLFNVVLLEGIMITTEILAMFLMSAILDMHLFGFIVNDSVMFYETAVTKIFYFVVAYLASKISFRELRKNKVRDFSFFLFVIPLLSVGTIISFVYLSINLKLNNNIYFIFSLICLFFLLSNVIIFWVHEKVVRTLTENMEYQIDKQRAEINQEYYAELQRQYDLSGILVHDIKKHLRIVREMSEKNDNAGIIKYIDSVYKSGEINTLRQYSDNKLVNVIISRYANLCAENKIQFNCDIRSIDFSPISESDLTALLDNLLENSYEAARLADNKFIDVKIDTFNGSYIVFAVKNSFEQIPLSAKGNLKTTKKDSDNHGIGTKSIKRIAKRYDGQASFDYETEENIFSVKVILKGTMPE